MKIYIASEYGRRRGLSEEQCEANVHKALDAARKLILKGHIPFVPVLYHYISAGWVDSPEEDVWTEMVSSWLPDCDALLQVHKPLDETYGVWIETEMAKTLRMPVFYNIGEVPNGKENNTYSK
ncbi:MAG TPA: DUF1937 family protein [bacterium]|nr:DUF1937 family protein [bacterium]